MAKDWQNILDDFSGSKPSSSSKTSTSSNSGSSQNKSNNWQSTLDDFSGSSRNKKYDDAIAPVASRVITSAKKKKKKEEEEKKKKKSSFFDSELFKDGYDFGDITKTILGVDEDTASLKDLTVNSVKRGYYNAIYGEESFKSMNGDQNYKDVYRQILAGDDYQFTPGNKAASAVSGAMELVGQKVRQFTNPRTLGFVGAAVGATAIAGNAGPQALIPEEILTIPSAATAAFTAGSAASNLEIEAGHAYNEMVEAGISEETAKKVAWGVGGVNAGLELLQVDELLDAYKVTAKNGATKTFTKKILDELVDRGVDVAKETAQEVAQEGVTIAGVQVANKLDNGEYVYSADEVKDRLKDTAMSSALSFGLMNAPAAVKNTASIVSEQKKANTLTVNEQKVVDQLYKERVSEAGENVSQKAKSKIYDQVLSEMEKGYISTDDIERILGGKKMEQYTKEAEWEKSLQDNYDKLSQEYEELYNMKNGEKSSKQVDREAELKEMLPKLKTQLANVKATSTTQQTREQISQEVRELVNGEKLAESYNERSRRGQVYEADLSQYDSNQRKVIQKAVESGVLNNTRRTHEFVDIIAKISADKGVLFDFTNNAKLKESGFAVEGKTVNGYVTKDGITLNVDSPKAWQSTVGHEITHVLEGTELYNELQKTFFDYARSKNELGGKWSALKELYKDVKDADVNAELTADLVGEYLFTDEDFINNLSTGHRNVFQKIYDEIKYLYKVATAGSKEARELEKVKKAFDKAYREGSKTQTDTKYSISDKNIKDISTGYGYGESYYTMSYTQDGKTVATLQYGEYDGQPNVKMIEVDPEYRRKGIATKLMQELQRKYPDAEIDFGMSTPDGTKLLESITYDVTDEAVVADRQKLKNLQTELNELQEKLDVLYDTENLTEEQDAELHKLGDRWQEVYETIFELSENLRGKKATRTFVKTDTKYSLSDSDGRQLTAEQQEYFKDSKMRDENGNLKVMYHGSQDAGFHVFDPSMSDDGTSFFFVDRNDVAASYSGTSETYEAKTIRTAEDMNKFLAEIGHDDYEVEERDGKFFLYQDDDFVAKSDTAQGIYEEFCWYEGVGEGDANYKVYLDLKNPLVVDAKGRPWNKIDAEFSQEVYDKFQSLTDEEKAALVDLAEWEDFRIFNSEIQEARDNELASAYQKLGEDINIYDVFSVASDNFSEESMRENSRKYLKTRDYAQKAKSEGYDGVIFKNIVDNGGYSNGSEGASTVAIAFDSNQIKSVANEKPTVDADIRYSLNEEVTDEQNERGLDAKSEVTFSLSKDTEYMDKAISMNASGKQVSSDAMTNAKVLRERIAGRMNDIKDRGLVALPDDIEGNTYIANSSYDGTEENTTICPRSLASEAFVDAVSEYLGRPLSVKEQIYISQDLQGRSMTPECTYCYVATDRKAYRAFLGEYVAQRDAVLQKVKDNPNADVSRSGELYKEFLNGRKDTNPMYSRFKMWVDAYKNGKPMVDASHLANINKLMGDINSEFGAELKPQIVDAMKYAQSASWAKKRINYVAYNGHILKWKQDRINKLNSHYGLRMYSFSDFHPAFVLENMQMITDASVRGLKMLGYTKDIDFVDIFAPSGMNINVSTFGFETGGNVYENNLIGAEWEKAKALRNQYPNVGITFVATNDNLVNWALEQDWIDVVIPFHLVRTGKDVADWFKYNDYTSESSDTKTKEWVKGDKKYIAPTEHNNDKATYLDALAKNHLKPRFERFIDNPNYMKLVNECRQPASVSKPVQPVFNEDAAMVALAKLEANGYYQPIGGSVDRMYEIAAEVAENMPQELAPAMSLSNEGDGFKRSGNFATPATELRYEAPVSELVTENTPTAEDSKVVAENATATPSVSEMETVEFPDDLAPVQTELDELMAEADGIASVMEAYASTGDIDGVNRLLPEYEAIKDRIRELQEPDNERVSSLGDADAPPEMEAPYYGESEPVTVDNPFEDRNWNEVVGRQNRSVKAYMYEHPEVKPFFQAEAQALLGEFNDTQRGERIYNDEIYYASGGEMGWTGIKRLSSESMETMLDEWGMSYDEIERGLNAIIKDNGAENISAAKKVEFMLNDRLLNGYKNFYDKGRIEPNQEYINLVNEMQITSYSDEARRSLFENADAYAPPVEDVAPVKPMAPQTPVFEAKEPDVVKGQTSLFEPPKPNPRVANVLTDETQITKEKSGIAGKIMGAVVDKGYVFEKYSHETGNHEIQAKWNSALSSNTNKQAQYFMENGTESVPALKDVLKEVNKSGKKQDFFAYLYHAHNVDRMSREERFHVPNKTVFGETVTADVSRGKVKQYERANPEFKDWAEDIYAITKHMRGLLLENNLISPGTYSLWEKMYPHYVPVGRVDADGRNISVPLDTKKTGVNSPVKRAEGGSSDIRPLDVVLAERIEQTYSAIARNRFGIELKNTMGTTVNSQQNTAGVDEAIDTIEAQEELLKAGTHSSNPTFTVFENGERIEFEITEDMYDALKPAGKLLGYRNKGIKAVGDARRNLLTQWNPVFALYRNPIKDLQEVAVNSQHAVKTYLNIPNAIYQMATDGKFATEYHQNGGKGNSYFDSRTKKFKVEDNAFKKVIGMPIRAIENAGEFIEEIPRLAEYIASRKEGRSIDRSMLDAARVTTNFAAGGDFTKFLNSHGFTFLNASVQGAAQHVRNIREAKEQGLKGYVKVLAKYTVAGLPGILLNNLLWDDDEDYEELNDYVKQNYYVVAKTEDGKFIRIPKGRTAAVMQNAMEQMGHLVTGDDEADFGTFFELFMNNIAPNNPIENNILAPVFQVAKNKAWYGDDLVPTRLQKLPTEEQFDESTDSISKWLGENFDPFDLGPYKINYLLDQYSGGLGDMILPTLTPEAESGDNSLMGNILAPWKKEITTDKVLNNKYPGNFYDLKDELEVKSNSRNATEEDTMRSMYMDSVSWEMSDLYKQKREVQNSDLPDDEKYEEVRNIQEQINAIAENALNNYHHVSINGLYSEAGDRRYNYDAEKDTWYEIKPKTSDGEDNWYYIQEKLSHDKLGISYSDFWNGRRTPSEGATYYGEYNGKRYNYDDENSRWYEITPKNDDGSDNWFYQKEQEVTKGLGISYEEYWNNREEYNFAYDKPGHYAISQAVGGYDSYLEHYEALNNWQSDNYISADKDSNGDTIIGSRKEKVKDYIDGLDLDYGEKLILYRSVYSSKKDKQAYNMKIVDYLNSRDDISYEEMKSILEELEMEVDDEGYISWD